MVRKPVTGLSLVLAMGCAGGALASPFDRSTRATAAATWIVSVDSRAAQKTATLYPRGAPEKLTFTISSDRARSLKDVRAAVAVDRSTGDGRRPRRDRRGDPKLSRAVVQGGADASDPGLPATLVGPGDMYRGMVDLTMVDVPADQNACADRAPAVTVQVTH